MMKTMIMIMSIAVAVAAGAATVDEQRTRVLQTNNSTETKDYASLRGYEACNHDVLTKRDCLAIGCCQWTNIERAGNSTHHCATAVNDGAFCLRPTETPSSAPIDVIDGDYYYDFNPYDDDDGDDYGDDYDLYDGDFFDNDDYYRDDNLPIVIIIPVMIVCAIIVACCFYHSYITKETNDNNGTRIHNNNTPPPVPIPGSEAAQATATALPSTTNNTQGATTPLQKLSKEQRIQLYNIVFDTNGNQLTLESKHIFMKSTTSSNNAEEYIDIDIGPDYDQDDDDNKMFEGSFYLGVDSARFDSIPKEDNNDDDDDAVVSLERGGSGEQRQHRSSAIHHSGGVLASERSRRSITHTDGSVHTIVSVRNTQNICISSERGEDTTRSKTSNAMQGSTNSSSTSSNQNMVPGMCIICFDEFITGDVIVWSDNKKCEHFYHKECLVPYLAHNAQPKTYSTLNVNNNPCPTCRQKYCTVPTTILDTFIRNNDNDAPATSGGGGDGRDRWGLEENTTSTTTPIVATSVGVVIDDAAMHAAYRRAAHNANRVH